MDTRRQSGLWNQNAEGNYERVAPPGPFKYYQPPPATSDRRRSYSERAADLDSPISDVASDPVKAATQDGLVRSTSVRDNNTVASKKLGKIRTSAGQENEHKRSAYQPDSPRSIVSDDSIPANLRANTWSPEPDSPDSPTTATVPHRQVSNASQAVRRGSVPDRSPLQNLEARLGDISKEEKRARVQQAERNAVGENGQLARSATLRSEKPRVLSDGSRRANDSIKRDGRRNVSEGALPDENGTRTLNRAGGADPQRQDSEQYHSGTTPNPTPDRTSSQRYRHRARDAGFAGAASAMAGADEAAARGKAAYERRRTQGSDGPGLSATTPSADAARTKSSKLQKTPPSPRDNGAPINEDSPTLKKDTPAIIGDGKHELHENRIGTGMSTSKDAAPIEPDPLPREDVRTEKSNPVSYQVPPQTAAGRQAKERVTFAPDVAENDPAIVGERHHGFKDMFGHHIDARGYQAKAKPLEDWRNAEIAKLSAADLVLDDGAQAGAENDSAWWEKSHSAQPQLGSQAGQAYDERAVSYDPPLFLKCGPLLRFTGLQKPGGGASGPHLWRGSILIVTEDGHSDLTRPPTLRLFAQHSQLYTKDPSSQLHDPEEEDAVTGLMKTSRTGRPIYVRSLHEIEHGVDLSRTENNRGLFSAAQPKLEVGNATQRLSRVRAHDGERLGAYHDIRAHRLSVEQGCTFWRFNLEIELGSKQSRVAYRINNGPATGFWLPARGETMNMMFHSCNGFSLAVDPAQFCGPDPLWRDVLNRHQSRPFHVMIGGGDQIYNDAAIRDTTLFKEWLQIKNPSHKHHADFTVEMQDELEAFYFNRYAMWFSQGLFSMANAQIPMVNMWDDHDIIDGFGSYPHHFMSSPVFAGIGAIAYKYYMLFQHQSLPTETTAEEPSWLLGASPGPYISELSRSVFAWLGDRTALLALDCRTERMRDEILSQESYDMIFNRCRAEIIAGHTKHLIVLLGVPIAYPRLNFLENILTSRLMDPIKAIGRTGMLGGFVNKFDGGVEILDDLDDHWTAKHHKQERNWFVQELQELAAQRSVRITILGGDVHLGAVGQFYSNKALGISKDQDHRYMPNVISSAIVNTPPPVMMADVLNKRNKTHHLDHETDEDMIPMFDSDVDGSRRNNKHLLPRRNFAIIKEYMPGTTPPSTPPAMDMPSHNSLTDPHYDQDAQTRPGARRSMSLTRGPSKLIRRLSLRSKNPPVSLNASQPRRPFSFHEDAAASKESAAIRQSNDMSSQTRPSLSFHRRPTNLSLKEARMAAARGGPSAEDGEDVEPGHINLEGGLDITLCMEVDQHDPSGHTVPYRLLVPALWYKGSGDRNTLTLPNKQKQSVLQRLSSIRKPKVQATNYDNEDHDEEYAYNEASANGQHLSTSAELGPRHAENEESALYNHDNDRNREMDDLRATAAGASNTSRYGTSDVRGQPHEAYQKGYDLRSPPLGRKDEQAVAEAANRGGYFDDRETPDSLTASEVVSQDYEEAQEYEDRRTSKADRFLGIDDGGANVLRKKSQGAGKTPRWKQLFRSGSTRGEDVA